MLLKRAIGCTLISLALSGIVCSVVATTSKEPVMRLYYVMTFNVETYIGITEDNIQKQGHTVWFMWRNPFMQELVGILESHPAKASRLNWIRVKADLRPGGDVYLVDRDGLVLKKSTGTIFRLTSEQMRDLEKRLKNLVGVVEMEAHKHISSGT